MRPTFGRTFFALRQADRRFRASYFLGLGTFVLGALPNNGNAQVPGQLVHVRQLPPSIAAAVARSNARIVTARAATTITRSPAGSPATEAPAPASAPATAAAIAPAAQTIALKAGEFLTTAGSGPPLLVSTKHLSRQANVAELDSFVALPERIVGVAVDSDVAFLRPAYLPEGMLRYDATISLFRGGFSIGLEDSVRRSEHRKLTGAFRFQFGGADADSIVPQGVDVDHTNLPLTTIAVLARNPADSVQLRIITGANMEGTTVSLRAVPALAFGRLHAEAQGWGLERIPIVVSLLGTRRATPTVVSFSADHGSVEPTVITLGAGHDSTVVWRTGSLGTATIQAEAGEIGADKGYANVKFAFPLTFLIAAMVGGAIGAVVRQLLGRTNARSLIRTVSTGMLVGVLAAGIYCAINVSILVIPVNVPFFNESAVFALAALAGLLGVRSGSMSSAVEAKPAST